MSKPTVEQGYAQACLEYKNGNHGQAEVLCRQILRSVPTHRDTLLLMAILAQRGGKTAAGDDWFRQAADSSEFSITIHNKLDARPRWAPHPKISLMLEAGLDRYAQLLQTFEPFLPWLEKINFDADPHRPREPHWNNIWMPVLDAVALYCQVAIKRPRYFVEIGSGNSTRFVARAIADHKLDTKIISIDPQPRAEIDALCHEVLRKPLEDCSLEVFNTLDSRDIVFADNSHQAFMNSDVTVFFCEVMPALAQGVTVGIHDIFLPDDYPEEWVGRYYSEQYLLACYLLAEKRGFEVTLPVFFAAGRGCGGALMSRIRSRSEDPVWRTGSSFWLEMH